MNQDHSPDFLSVDERAIRQLVATWMEATQVGDAQTVLNLMADDVVFMVPGQEPFGKREFAAASAAMTDMQFQGTSEIVELKVLGDWAWARSRLRVEVIPAQGDRVVRSGYVLSIFTKRTDGQWVIARDANLLTTEAGSSAG